MGDCAFRQKKYIYLSKITSIISNKLSDLEFQTINIYLEIINIFLIINSVCAIRNAIPTLII